ncbi:WD40 repeat domain-containing serine/threonine protein kinase [Actinomadura sp. 3N407]|uniref:WD40 repeat domain-containing serine/threonine protein kinase n=1 Tax=Actinomadura sp. 3N407 TaxID=3457423 RepID=UPI003FCC5AAD
MQTLRPQDPPSVGPYRLERRLGEGGMGQVFLGISPGGRQVAVKVIRAEHAADTRFRARFAREVEAARRVGGFYTAQVVDADPDAAEPWMATAYVPGPSLRDQITRDGPLTPDAVRRLGAALTEGLAAVHACGLVHRDLKPGNVIMSPDGPRIIDFGIARTADATTLTATGAVVGTYAYMAPEQIRADRAGPAADVFALGCVLAFAATGHAPFQAGSVPMIVQRIVAEPPRLDGMEGDLHDLVAACLDKDPGRRPALDEIGRRLTASPAVPPRRIPRRALIAGAAAATAAAIGVPAALLLSRPDETPAKPPPYTPTGAPTETTVLVGRPLSPDHLTFVEGARTLMAVGLRAVWYWKPSTGEHKIIDMPEVLDYGTQALSADGRILAGCFDAHIAIGDAATGTTIRRIDLPDRPVSLALTADGARLAANHGDTVDIWDVRTGRRTGPRFGDGVHLAYSPDGRLLAGGRSQTGPIWIWDTATGRTVAELDEPGLMALTFSPDGTLIAGSIDYSHDVHLWDARTGRKIRTLRGHTEYVRTLAFSPDGGTLASGGKDKTVRLWNTRTGASIATLTDDTDEVSTLAFAPDGRSIAGATRSGTVRIRRFT